MLGHSLGQRGCDRRSGALIFVNVDQNEATYLTYPKFITAFEKES